MNLIYLAIFAVSGVICLTMASRITVAMSLLWLCVKLRLDLIDFIIRPREEGERILKRKMCEQEELFRFKIRRLIEKKSQVKPDTSLVRANQILDSGRVGFEINLRLSSNSLFVWERVDDGSCSEDKIEIRDVPQDLLDLRAKLDLMGSLVKGFTMKRK